MCFCGAAPRLMGSGIRQYVVLMTLTPQSLRRRLPLFISTLLIIVVAAVCWLSYREIEHVLVAATNARLTSATQQLADILGESTHRSDADLRRVADNSGIINLLEHPTNEARNEAHAVLEQERRRNADGYGQSVSGGIVDRNGRVVLFHGAAFPIDPLLLAAANTEPPANQPTGQTYSPQLSTHRVRIGRFSRTDSGVAYAASTPIVDKSGNSIGWLVQYRRVPSAQAIAQIGAIIGPSARLLVGNADGSIWTDFRRIVSGPPGESRRQGPWEYATVDGEREIGVVTTVPNTTWSVWVEIPRSGAVAAGKPFLARIAFIGLIFVIVGTMLASIVPTMTKISPMNAILARNGFPAATAPDRGISTQTLHVVLGTVVTTPISRSPSTVAYSHGPCLRLSPGGPLTILRKSVQILPSAFPTRSRALGPMIAPICAIACAEGTRRYCTSHPIELPDLSTIGVEAAYATPLSVRLKRPMRTRWVDNCGLYV